MQAIIHAADIQDRDGGVLLMGSLFGLYPFLLKLYAATSVKVVEKAGGLEVATDQAALGGSCRVSLAGGGLSISPMASTPM